MPKKYLIEDDKRKRLRDINKIMGKDLRKYITELLTNSDDSYERMEKEKPKIVDDIKIIEVELYRSKREIVVKDEAEGMSEKTLVSIFQKYGADTSRSHEVKSVRGMFGQGATDVMFSAAIEDLTAKMISIKDGKCAEVDFCLEGFDKQRVINIPEHPIDLETARLRYNIRKNGTVVIFGVPKAVNIPRTDNLASDLSSFYMLRFLLSKQNRKVKLVDVDSGKSYVLKYDMNEFRNFPLLVESDIKFEVDGNEIIGNIVLRHQDDKNPDEGILVYENGIAFDNHFFDRRNFAGMNKVVGRLKLIGAIDLIRKFLNEDKPEEIISDTRDGFNKNHDFYKIMKTAVEKHIIVACEKVEEENRGGSSGLKSQKEFNQIFKELNKLIREELEEISPSGGFDKTILPPSEGLRFVRPKINITNGKQYSIKLIVNTEIVPFESVIEIINLNKEVEIKQKYVKVPFSVTNPVYIDLTIIAKDATEQTIEVVAESDSAKAKLFIDVINKNIHYPAYGLEFFPNILQKKPLIESKGHLYVDLNKHPIGSRIKVSCDHADIQLSENTYTVSENDLLTSDIAMINVEVAGGNDNTSAVIMAEVKTQQTDLKVLVRNKEESELNKSGFINDVVHKSTLDFVQSYFQSTTGEIVINDANLINKVFLRSWFEGKNMGNEQKRYIADICSIETAKLLIKKKVEKGKIDVTDFDVYMDELQKEKIKVFNIFLKVFGS